MITISLQKEPLICGFLEPPWGIEPQTYALRACHDALPLESVRHRRCGSQGAAVGGCWLFTVLRGHLGGTPLLPLPTGRRTRLSVVPGHIGAAALDDIDQALSHQHTHGLAGSLPRYPVALHQC